MKQPKKLNDCNSILDIRDCARPRLPSPIFHFLDGAAETERTAQRNTAAFDEEKLIPRCLVDVGVVKTSTRILGQDLEWPVFCAPTGASRLFHPDGELAVARAAANAGTLYALSTASTYSIEEVAVASSGPKMFQIYVDRDRDVTRDLIMRCKRSGYAALCLTVDTPAGGKRERDLRSGFSVEPKWSLQAIASYAQHPAWVIGQLLKGPLRMANFAEPSSAPGGVVRSKRLNGPDPSVTWRDVRDFKDLWGGPFAIKGIMSVEDACRAADSGVTAVIISNHGGRQLDGAATPIEVLPEIHRAVGDRVEVILDGGIRRGVHVVKALARGAKACSIGRPYLYGLGAGGEAGVAKALGILRAELVLAMQLSGCPDVESIDDSLVRRFS